MRSEVEPGNGEDAYSALVREHLRPDLDVLEAGCGHGTDALAFGPHVRSHCGYDAVEPSPAAVQLTIDAQRTSSAFRRKGSLGVRGSASAC